MALTILVTGFGPFPGAPVNPTGPLVRALKRSFRRPGVKLAVHVFETSYVAVDRDLPKLIERHKPDALLMFGLATRSHLLRVETLARNVVSARPDVSGKTRQRRNITPRAPATLAMPTPARMLLAALHEAQVPAWLSRNAGNYLCNYLCWRATEAAGRKNGPRMAAFVHIPPMRRGNNGLKPNDLARAGRHALTALAAAARH